MNDNAPGPAAPPPPRTARGTPIVGWVGESGVVVLTRPLSRPRPPALRLVDRVQR